VLLRKKSQQRTTRTTLEHNTTTTQQNNQSEQKNLMNEVLETAKSSQMNLIFQTDTIFKRIQSFKCEIFRNFTLCSNKLDLNKERTAENFKRSKIFK
jgi:hypothetical protein